MASLQAQRKRWMKKTNRYDTMADKYQQKIEALKERKKKPKRYKAMLKKLAKKEKKYNNLCVKAEKKMDACDRKMK